jgi:butyryl-CoA dehydrogenase
VYAGAVPFLMLTGYICGGWQMARAALAAQRRLAKGEGDRLFNSAKIATARFFADHYVARAGGLVETIVHGAPSVMALEEEQF